MSALLNQVPPRAANTSILFTEGVTAPDHFHNGLPYEADGSIAGNLAGSINHYHQGLAFTANGRLCYNLGQNANYYAGSGAVPHNPTGRLKVNTIDLTHCVHGVCYTANGVVGITLV